MEITDEETLARIGELLAKDVLRARVLDPDIYKAAGGIEASEEFQRACARYDGFNAIDNLLMDLHNGVWLSFSYSEEPSANHFVEAFFGKGGRYEYDEESESGTAVVTDIPLSEEIPFLYYPGYQVDIAICDCIRPYLQKGN